MYNQGMYGLAQQGGMPQVTTYPQVSNIAQQQAQQGYQGGYGPLSNLAVQGAVQGLNLGSVATGNQLLNAIPQLNALAAQFPGLGQQYGQQVANLGTPFPALGQQYGGQIGQLAQGLTGLGPQAAAQTQAAMPAISQIQNMMPGAAGSILQTAMDPQRALYNQTAQQTLDQNRAIAAMSGVGTSPYGAGLTQQAMNNFNINWQNQQLQRQLQGIVGAGQAGTTAATLGGQLGNLAGLGLNQQIMPIQSQAGLLANAMGLQQQGATTAAGLYGSGLGLMGQGANQAANLYGQALGLGGQGAQLAAQSGALPYSTITQQAQNAINALMQQTQLGQSTYALPQTTLSDLASYLGMGQQAASAAGLLGAQAAQQMGANYAGLGMLAAPASNLLFGSGGLSGALGLGSTGLLGGGLGGLGSAMSGASAAPFFGGVGSGLAATTAPVAAADTGAKALAPLALA